MAKIKLGARPKNFKRVISVPMLEGGTGTIEVSYIYRTKTQFGELLDELFAEAGEQLVATDDAAVKASMKRLMEATRDKNGDYIMKILDGWNLDVEFSAEAVNQLCDELPGAALEIMSKYRDAISDGRLGN